MANGPFWLRHAAKKSAPAWYSLYASNIADYLEEHGSFSKRGTYTRVVLAFTALGQDASNLKLHGTTYDLTAKLLEKKADGNTMQLLVSAPFPHSI